MWEQTKHICDWIATTLAVGVIMKFLPLLLGVPSCFYSCIRIYEWWKGRKNGNVKLD